MLWLLLVAILLIRGRTYVWSIMLWFYGRPAEYEPVETSVAPLADAWTAPVSVRKAAPAFPRPAVPPRATYLQPAA
jgi:hypothetical protein